MIKSLKIAGILLSIVMFPMYTQAFEAGRHTAQDSAIIFRFVPQKLMFYTPFKGNDRSIERLQELIEQHKEEITAGNAFISVQGFCGSYPSRQENLKAAKNRTNQVKTYFITHNGMKEAYYRTQNHATAYDGQKDVVAYIRLVYAEGYIPPHIRAQQEAEARAKAEAEARERQQQDSIAREQARIAARAAFVRDSIAREQALRDSLAAIPVREYRVSPWSVKTNLLYDAVLMPSLEVEYRFNERWSVNLEGTMAWWHNDGRHKYYQLATISPEARYWFKPQGRRKGHYVSLFGGFGWYDLENGGKGYRGEGEFVGAGYGYMFPVGKYFSFEAGLGLGYMHTKYDEYLPIDGHYVYQQASKLNYFGPLKLKFSWVWHIGQWIEKKGGNQ